MRLAGKIKKIKNINAKIMTYEIEHALNFIKYKKYLDICDAML